MLASVVHAVWLLPAAQQKLWELQQSCQKSPLEMLQNINLNSYKPWLFWQSFCSKNDSSSCITRKNLDLDFVNIANSNISSRCFAWIAFPVNEEFHSQTICIWSFTVNSSLGLFVMCSPFCPLPLRHLWDRRELDHRLTPSSYIYI